MKYVTAGSIVTLYIMTGYTDRTPAWKWFSNLARIRSFHYAGFDLKKDHPLVSFEIERFALQFLFTFNQN
jgi:hypothetical protein